MASDLDQFPLLESIDRFPTIDDETIIVDPVKYFYFTFNADTITRPRKVFTLKKNHMILAPVIVNIQEVFSLNDFVQIGTLSNSISIARIQAIVAGVHTTFSGRLQTDIYKATDADIDIYVTFQHFFGAAITSGQGWVLIKYINLGLVPGFRRT